MAGLPVRLRVMGKELSERTARTFSHLAQPEEPSRAPDLVVDLWDVEETGVAPPRTAWGASVPCRWSSGIGDLVSSEDNRFVGCVHSHGASWLDRADAHIVGYWTAAREQSLFDYGKPLFFPLSLWYHDKHFQVVHAAFVSCGERGVLLPAIAGAGKSTCAIACLLDGFHFLADDHVSVEWTADRKAVGHSMYGCAWLTPEHLDRFPLLRGLTLAGKPPPADKVLLFADDARPNMLRKKAEIAVLLIPRIREGDSTVFVRASEADAVRSLALGTLSGAVPRPGPKEIERLGQLARATPCFRLDMGRRIEEIPRAVRRLLEEV